MSKQALDTANAYVRRCLTQVGRRINVICEWFNEASLAREARGLKLLREWLSPDQLAQYEANGYFDVTGCHSGKRYRIRYGVGLNVYEIDECGQPRAGLCFVPEICLVAGDVILAQKIALETDERRVLAVANTFPVRWSACR
jgi:hypothetical protein